MVQWLSLGAPNGGGPGSIPDQETRAHTWQLRVSMLQLKNLNTTTKIEDPAMSQLRPGGAK